MPDTPHRSLRLDDLLEGWRTRAADRPIFVDNGRGLTMAEFDQLVAASAAWLVRHGIGAGDCVAVWLLNRVEWLALLFAAARLGTRIAAVNTRYRAFELEHILATSQARMLILQQRQDRFDPISVLDGVDRERTGGLEAVAILGDSGPPAIAGYTTIGFQPNDEPIAEPPGADRTSDPDAPLAFFTTSGTTSAPKLVTHPQRTLALHALACAASFGFDREGAALLAALPLCGVFGLNPVLAAIAGGAPVHIMPAFAARPASERIAANAITHLFGSDELFRRLCEEGMEKLRSLRYCGFAAFSPGAASAMREGAERGLPLAGVYGSSEVNALFAGQAIDFPLEERLKGGGRPSLGAEGEVRVRDPDSRALLEAGRQGELVIRAPTSFIGYHNNPQATGRAVDGEGFFRTGDVGYLRPDGSFVFIARGGDAIRLAGFLVDPVEIEDALKSISGIGDAQVVGVDNEGRMRPVAFVTTAAQGAALDEQAVIGAARDRLADFKVPLRVIEVEAFPTTDSANGVKVQKGKLREMAKAALARQSGG